MLAAAMSSNNIGSVSTSYAIAARLRGRCVGSSFGPSRSSRRLASTEDSPCVCSAMRENPEGCALARRRNPVRPDASNSRIRTRGGKVNVRSAEPVQCGGTWLSAVSDGLPDRVPVECLHRYRTSAIGLARLSETCSRAFARCNDACRYRSTEHFACIPNKVVPFSPSEPS